MTAAKTRKAAAEAPKVGFVSLGCPKALVDSERILTRLRAEGYLISGSYRDADLVVVNTCGFIDAAVDESLDAIGEALAENGKVIVTGCLGAQGNVIKDAHPRVLAVTGPHATEEVMSAVHSYLPKPHDPFVDLVPPQGIKLTPKHFAYLKIAEGCNHRCTFCIIPSMRGDLVSRPVGEVMQEAENLVKAGVKELLVISQDTSAYGVDVRYRTGFWGGRPLKTRMTELTRALGQVVQDDARLGQALRTVHQHRHLAQPGHLRRAPAALAGDQFVLFATDRSHQQRLHQALCLDGRGKLLQGLLVHARARLVFAGPDRAHRQRQQRIARPFLGAEERIEPSSKPLCLHE